MDIKVNRAETTLQFADLKPGDLFIIPDVITNENAHPHIFLKIEEVMDIPWSYQRGLNLVDLTDNKVGSTALNKEVVPIAKENINFEINY